MAKNECLSDINYWGVVFDVLHLLHCDITVTGCFAGGRLQKSWSKNCRQVRRVHLTATHLCQVENSWKNTIEILEHPLKTLEIKSLARWWQTLHILRNRNVQIYIFLAQYFIGKGNLFNGTKVVSSFFFSFCFQKRLPFYNFLLEWEFVHFLFITITNDNLILSVDWRFDTHKINWYSWLFSMVLFTIPILINFMDVFNHFYFPP